MDHNDNRAPGAHQQASWHFHIAEFEQLSQEKQGHINQIRFLQRAVVIVPALAYGWIFSRLDADDPVWIVGLAWAPLVIHVFIWNLREASSKFIVRIAAYIHRIEEALSQAPLDGWEHHIAAVKRDEKRSMFRTSERLGWTFILLLIIAAASTVTINWAAQNIGILG